MARHYGIAVLPARPYKPKDKAKAEVGVQLVERWILARLRHHTFHSLAEINVEIVHKNRRVAVHPRRGPSRYSTLSEHMPESHRRHREWSPGRFLNWAQTIGPATCGVVKRQFEDRPHPEHGYRACLGILNLSRHYGHARLEAACRRALRINSPRYRSVASILKVGLDAVVDEEPPETAPLPLHDNVRGPRYYH